MEKRRRKKHQAHKRGLLIVNEHRPYLTSTPGGAATVAKVDQGVADESAAFAEQENSDSEERSAGDRARKARRTLRVGLKHVATVSAVVMPAGGEAAPFDATHPPNDEQLIGRVEAIHAAASADLDAFTKGGVQPGMLDAFAADLVAFKKAKATLALSVKQHAEAADRFDVAYEQTEGAFAILEGILATSPDAPAGALSALRAARRIGPRIVQDNTTPETPGEGTTTDTTHTPAVTTTPADPQKAA